MDRTCTKCGETKPITEYTRHKSSPDGIRTYCKACAAASRRDWYERNAESEREASRQYKREHPDEIREYKRDYHRRNRERVNEHRREQYRENHDERRAAWREYAEANRDAIRALARRLYHRHTEQRREEALAYYYNNRERALEKARINGPRWKAANPEKMRAMWTRRRARKAGNGGSHTAQEWLDLKARYDNRCLCCGKREPEIALTVDHVIPIARGGSDDIDNIQPLCRLCNLRKHTKTTDYRS
jgi:5-methylcytosine-specific restriction endonuclease McrA